MNSTAHAPQVALWADEDFFFPALGPQLSSRNDSSRVRRLMEAMLPLGSRDRAHALSALADLCLENLFCGCIFLLQVCLLVPLMVVCNIEINERERECVCLLMLNVTTNKEVRGGAMSSSLEVPLHSPLPMVFVPSLLPRHHGQDRGIALDALVPTQLPMLVAVDRSEPHDALEGLRGFFVIRFHLPAVTAVGRIELENPQIIRVAVNLCHADMYGGREKRGRELVMGRIRQILGEIVADLCEIVRPQIVYGSILRVKVLSGPTLSTVETATVELFDEAISKSVSCEVMYVCVVKAIFD